MNISHIPNKSGVYFFKDKNGNILYIGKAKDLQKRVSQYFSPGSVWKQEMLSMATSVDFLIVQNESEALYLEDNLIKKHKPYYNNMLKGSNSYAYIKITKEEFPQIFITRKKIQDGSTYIGPKHNTIHLKKFFQYIRQVLQYRGCKTSQFKQGKLCSDYYFGLCKGRCTLPVMLSKAKHPGISKIQTLDSSLHSEGQVKNDYKQIITYIESFFRGDIKPIQKEILNQIDKSVQSQNFERAAKLRDIYTNIQSLSEGQNVVINKDITGYIFKIKKIGNRFVYVLLYFNQGKLIDIIRHKFHQDESDINSIISSISNECGEFILDKDPNSINASITGINKSIKKLNKSDKIEIDKLIEGFFDSFVISTSFEGENLNNELLSQIQSRYNLSNFPYHIECIDISHLGGSWASGGLSCFIGGLPEKKYYRRYKISRKSEVKSQKSMTGRHDDLNTGGPSTLQTKGDDYSSLKEVLKRRLKIGPKSKVASQKLNTLQTGGLDDSMTFMPNLIILDGGKGQLGIIQTLYNDDKNFKKLFKNIDFISLGKGPARKKTNIGKLGSKGKIGEKIYYFNSDFNIKSIDLIYDQADKILINIRDEAHRFANSYREKQMLASRKK